MSQTGAEADELIALTKMSACIEGLLQADSQQSAQLRSSRYDHSNATLIIPVQKEPPLGSNLSVL